jgi:asparagine synthase (glutamine-hydrolysing)
MCGIAGCLYASSFPGSKLPALGSIIGHTLAHRGPDGAGEWSDSEAGIVLAHRRLSILDLSEAGAQPMMSQNGRFVIVYNGEVYNASEMQRELELSDLSLRGHSDTEVILEAIARWGVQSTIARLNGIFALALWDRQERRLYLARDRLGIKPLFWGKIQGGIAFASELKALRAIPNARFELNPQAVAAFTMLSYVPTPYSIYRGIEKLKPGTLVVVDVSLNSSETPYATLDTVVRRARSRPFIGSEADAIQHLDELLRRTIRRQMIADVPVGAFLSGGIDSSMIVATIMAEFGKVQTFTVKNAQQWCDESAYARAIADKLGSNHHEHLVTGEEALSLVPRLPEIADEPFADVSLIPTFFICQRAREQVTVALSGDGGDELFSGYRRYMVAPKIFEQTRLIPQWMREALADAIHAVPSQLLDNLCMAMPGKLRTAYGGTKIHKAGNILKARSLDEVFFRQVTAFPKAPMAQSELDFSGFNYTIAPDLELSAADRMQFIDELTYLTDNNLAKVDRASMANSLEVRVPLLDNEILDFVWSLPENYKRKGMTGKIVLRRALERYVPRPLIDRPKMGFGVPISDWLRGPLRDWAESLLNERRLIEEGFFDAKVVRQYWREQMSGTADRVQALWNILMFQSWKARWL